MKKCSNHVIGFSLLIALPAAMAGPEPDTAAITATPAPLPSDNINDLRSTLSRYQDRLDSLRAEHGAYHPAISETLSGIGRARSKLGEHRAAAEAFRSAMHVARVNHGLHSLAQLPYLESLIKEYNLLGDLDNARDSYLYMYWVYKRNYGRDDPRLLPVIQEIAAWFRENYAHDMKDYPVEKIRKLQDLNYKTIEIARAGYGEHDPRMIEPLQRFVDTNLYIARRLGEQLFRLDIDPDVSNCGFAVYSTNGNEAIVNQETYQMIRDRCNSYNNGRRALGHIVAIRRANEAPPDKVARALTRLGDWEMLFERRLSALKHYSRAYELLAATETGIDQINQIFGQPRRLTSLNTFQENKTAVPVNEPDGKPPFAVVSLDVSSYGRPKNIEILESSPSDDTELQRDARRNMQRSIFRPRMENGEPVDTVGYKVTYIDEP